MSLSRSTRVGSTVPTGGPVAGTAPGTTTTHPLARRPDRSVDSFEFFRQDLKVPSLETAELPSPPPAGSRARRTHDALLDAAERLLADGGYPAATTTAIAEAAQVGVGTVYAYFRDRDDVLAALLAARLDGILAAVEAELTTDRLLDVGLDAVLAGTVRTVVDGYRSHTAALRAALVQLPSSPAIRAVYWDRHDRSRRSVATFLRRAQAAGRVGQGEPDLLADTLLVLIQGLHHPLLLERGSRADRVADHVTRALAAVLAPAG